MLLEARRSDKAFCRQYSFTKILAIGQDALFIPLKAVFLFALEGAMPPVIAVHINHAVTLAHLNGTTGYEIDDAPHRITKQVNAILYDSILHTADMIPKVVNAVRVVNASVRFNFINCTKAIFSNEERLMIAVVHLVQRNAQTESILLPAPFTGFQIRIFAGNDQIAVCLFPCGIRGRDLSEVVGTGNKINRVFAEQLFIARLHLNLDVFRSK